MHSKAEICQHSTQSYLFIVINMLGELNCVNKFLISMLIHKRSSITFIVTTMHHSALLTLSCLSRRRPDIVYIIEFDMDENVYGTDSSHLNISHMLFFIFQKAKK
uniref:Uncharacterized protein n=1 Tax=Glossina palpalis gambiensis TaxID=67801 RepID=A0A1B0C668_9MUSC